MAKKKVKYRGIDIEIDEKDSSAKLKVGADSYELERDDELWMVKDNPYHSGNTAMETACCIVDMQKG